jgi:uncharacterized iron-regulated membrane protein
MKIFFRNIHLYLSLAAGLVIMTCCFTGAVLVFEKELQELFNHNRYFVKKETLQLPIEQLINAVKQKHPAAKIASVKVYSNPERSFEIGVSIPEKGNKKREREKPEGGKEQKESVQPNTGEKAAGKGQAAGEGRKDRTQGALAPSGGRPTHTVFINPYTAQVLDLYTYRETFFYTIFSLHRWLLGGESSIGKTITGVATVIFLFILITGIILWWPRNKAILKQRLKIKTNGSWKRINYDLHIVLGFYSAIFLFIFSFTALAWSFKWFNEGIYTVTNSSMKPAEPPTSEFVAGKNRISHDSAFIAITKGVHDVQYYNLRAPNDSAGVFTVTVLPIKSHDGATDNYYVDQYSGQIINYLGYKDKNLGQRVRSTFKPVHTGSVFGLPSKIIAFLACVCGVTFPVTGTIMWIKRLRRNNRKKTAAIKETVAAGDYDYED